MTSAHQEIEAKFYVRDLAAIEARLRAWGAVCRVPRTFEYNLRYDNPAGTLLQEHKVLRLRRFDDIRLTFKGPGQAIAGALARTEIELVVNDFENAQLFLNGLGYQVVMIYEKYRTLYEWGTAYAALDELPYGHFVEIEAENPEKITALACTLRLNPKTAVAASYQTLFVHLKQTRGLTMPHLTFEAFAGLAISPDDLGVSPADGDTSISQQNL